MEPPTLDEIKDVAHKAVNIFSKHRLQVCLFGSTAGALHGCTRVPNDVDLVVMTESHSQEELKQILARDRHSGFYTRAPRTFGATYRVLFCTLPGHKRSCKVDVVIQGTMEIPLIPYSRFTYAQGLPIMPIIPLLILKLKGWDDHRLSGRTDFRQKQYVDVGDINMLLQIAVRDGANLGTDLAHLPNDFVLKGNERLSKFIEIVRPGRTSIESWHSIGFEVSQYR